MINFLDECVAKAVRAFETAYNGKSPYTAEELREYMIEANRDGVLEFDRLYHAPPKYFADDLRGIGRRSWEKRAGRKPTYIPYSASWEAGGGPYGSRRAP